MFSPEFCLYCHQNPPWLKERESWKAKVEKRNEIISQQDRKIKGLKEINYNLRKKQGGQYAHTK